MRRFTASAASCVFSPPRSMSCPTPCTVLQPRDPKIIPSEPTTSSVETPLLKAFMVQILPIIFDLHLCPRSQSTCDAIRHLQCKGADPQGILQVARKSTGSAKQWISF